MTTPLHTAMVPQNLKWSQSMQRLWGYIVGKWVPNGYAVNRDLRYGPHNMAYFQGAKINVPISP